VVGLGNVRLSLPAAAERSSLPAKVVSPALTVALRQMAAALAVPAVMVVALAMVAGLRGAVAAAS
jgi:hypothetical protein